MRQRDVDKTDTEAELEAEAEGCAEGNHVM